jgi:hypothetical protein
VHQYLKDKAQESADALHHEFAAREAALVGAEQPIGQAGR